MRPLMTDWMHKRMKWDGIDRVSNGIKDRETFAASKEIPASAREKKFSIIQLMRHFIKTQSCLAFN